MNKKILRSEEEASLLMGQFEHQYGAFSILEGGISLWRLIRFEASIAIQNIDLHRAPLPRNQLLQSLPRAGWQLLVGKRGHSYIGKTSNSGLRDKQGARYRDIYFDDLIDAVPGGALFSSVDAARFAENTRNAYRRPIFDDTSIIVASAAMARLARRTPGHASQALADAIASGLGLPDFDARRIQRKYEVHRHRTALYRLVLQRFGIGAVLAANTGLFALMAAARSLNIPYVEVQHGDFGPHHPEAIPAAALQGDSHALLLPDCLAVFGQRDADRLAGTALGEVGRLRPVGAAAIARARQLRQAQFTANPACPVVTFTSQGLARSEIVTFLEQFLQKSTGPLRLNVRLHPGYDGDGAEYRVLAARDDRLVVMPGDAMPPTHEVIAMSDLHLSISSTCHYDSLGIGTPTAVLGLPGHSAMDELVASKAASRLESAEQLEKIVRDRCFGEVASSISDYFFKSDYIENMSNLLRELRGGA